MSMDASENKILQGSFYVTISAILYGLLGYLGTKVVIIQNTDISAMLFWRFLIAAIWILPFFLRKQRSDRVWQAAPMRSLLLLLIFGSLSYLGTSAFYFVASHYTGTGLAMVIFFAYPLGVALLGWLIDKKPLSKITLMALAGMMVGLL